VIPGPSADKRMIKEAPAVTGPPTEAARPPGTAHGWMKTSVFLLEIIFVLILLFIWILSPALRTSKNLWILFVYCFPSEFLIAVVPHEPVILYFGKFYAPLTVALVSASGTLLAETLNYSVFRYVSDLKLFQRVREKKTVGKIVRLFNRAPFFAVWIAGLTPIPFYPFRFLVVLARYPLAKYLLAVGLSRTPRFFILALAGHAIPIPDFLLIALFVVLIAAMNYPLVRNLIRRKRNRKNDAS